MAYRLAAFSGVGLDEALLGLVIDEHQSRVIPRLDKLWTYYRNPLRPAGPASIPATGPGEGWSRPGGWYRAAQEVGLPPRLVGREGDDRAGARREVVIENDIAWRIHAMVDFMFARPVTLISTARDESLRRRIERALDLVWERSGGIGLLQDMALLGHIHGHVDLLLRAGAARVRDQSEDSLARALEQIRVEVVEPRRGIPLLDPADYRRLAAYVIHYERRENALDPAGRLSRLLGRGEPPRRARRGVTEIMDGARRQLYEDGRLVDESLTPWAGDAPPVAHIQNISQPFSYEGLGEVEPLIPLQDELNTRLSDRASRVTLQSFKMYLAKGIDGFEHARVGPGQIWSTDNTEATVQEFGGDADSPAERAHILEIREALDKVSGVPPIASGVVRAKIGNLSSANALRITLMGVLSKTARKRVTYGRGIAEICRLILSALDHAGALRTDPADRGVRLEWADPLPVDLAEQVQAATGKLRLGVPRERLLAELGYSPEDPGVV